MISPLLVCGECRLVNDGPTCTECGGKTVPLSSEPRAHPLYGTAPARPLSVLVAERQPPRSAGPLILPNDDPEPV